MNDRSFKCVKVTFSDYANEIGILRRKAWENVDGFEASAFPEETWLDEFDDNAVHWCVFDRKKVIASARLGLYSSFEETPYIELMEAYKPCLKLPIASLNRLVVDIKYRGKGIRELLDKVRVEEAKKMMAKTIVGQAVSHRITGLQNLGFEYVADIGRIKELPNIELSLMIKHL